MLPGSTHTHVKDLPIAERRGQRGKVLAAGQSTMIVSAYSEQEATSFPHTNSPLNRVNTLAPIMRTTHAAACVHIVKTNHTQTQAYAHTQIHTHACAHTRACTRTHTHTHVHAHAHTHMLACTHACMHAHICACTHTRIHTHTHTHTHARTHACTHTHAHTQHTHTLILTCVWGRESEDAAADAGAL